MTNGACGTCGEALVDLGGLGSSPVWTCANPDCPTNWQRHLRCPTKSCGGRELSETTVGLGHQVYRCASCGFGFDPLQLLTVYQCDKCKAANMDIIEAHGSFAFKCPGCGHTFAVLKKK